MIDQTLNNRYKITARLGKGAMGIVYRALDTQTGQEVAVKVIARELALDHDMLERFRREGEALRQLRHPNIVGFVDMFTYEEQQVIVMEYVPGGSLHQLLKQGPLPLDRIRRIALELCDALTRAHHLSIIHRDLKPENVLLAQDGTPKLTDFGVARLVSEGTRLTGTGTQVGTPFYMSPEAWEGKSLDSQTDIWSLGILLYEMASGRVPFSGDTVVAVMNKVLNAPLPDLSTLRPDAPPGLVKIIQRMLERDKAERYQSMRELGADLERGEPLTMVAAKPTRAQPRSTPAPAAKPRAGAPAPARPLWPWLVGGLVVLAAVGLGALGLGAGWLLFGRGGALPWASPAPSSTPFTTSAPATAPAAVTPTQSAATPPPLTPAAGLPGLGKALWLDGQSGYMEVPFSASLDLSSELTLEAWVNPLPVEEGCSPDEPNCLIQPILSQPKANVSSVGNYLLALQQNTLLFGFQPSSGPDILWRSTPASLTGWHHVAVVHVFGQPDRIRAYLDGVPLQGNWYNWDRQLKVDPAEAAIPNSHAPYLLGYMTAGMEHHFRGSLDEVRIWRVARSQDEIRATMKQALSGRESGLAAYWNFDAPSPAGTVPDGSSNGNNGQLMGSALVYGGITPTIVANTTSAEPAGRSQLVDCAPNLCVADAQEHRTVVNLGDQYVLGLGFGWSPDGKRIVFSGSRAQDNTGGKVFTDLYLADLNGQNVTPLLQTSSQYEHFPAWSPDGKWIAYHQNCTLALIRPDGTDSHTLPMDSHQACPFGIAWSPDSQRIAWIGGSDTETNTFNSVWLIQPDGSGLQKLFTVTGTQMTGDVRDVAIGWSPDGNSIAARFQNGLAYLVDATCASRPTGCDAAASSQTIDIVPASWLHTYWPQWDGQAAATAGKTALKVGVLLPLSGPNAALGVDARDGTQMAVDEWNSQGGVLGKTILPVVADGQCNADPAVAAFNQMLAQEQALFLIGEICSRASIPVSAIAESKGVLQISPASTSPNVTLNEQGKTKAFVFRASFVDPFQGVVLANFARQQGLQQAYVIYDQSNPNSSGLAQYFLATFQKGGGRIAGQEPYTLETTDFGPILDRVAASQAQVLLIPDMGQRVNVIAQQARQKGLKAILMGGDGWEASDLDLAAVEGSYYTTAYSTLDPNAQTQAWAARYRTRYNRDPNALAALGYDAANLLFTAIQQAGTDDPAKVKDVLAGLKFEGVTGQFSFDAQHNPVKSAIVMQIKNGQRVYAGTVEP